LEVSIFYPRYGMEDTIRGKYEYNHPNLLLFDDDGALEAIVDNDKIYFIDEDIVLIKIKNK
jgi:hypothetical protein